MSTGEWRNPLGYEERYAGVPPVSGKAVEEFAPLNPWPDPIDERLQEIRFANLREWAEGYRDACGMDQHRRAQVLDLLDLITSLREVERAARRVITPSGSTGYAWPSDGQLWTLETALARLDATHRPPLSGET